MKDKAKAVNSTKELVMLVNNHFGVDFTYKQVRGIKKEYRIFSGKSGQPRKFSSEIIAFMKNNVSKVSNVELTEMVNIRFGTSFTVQQIRSARVNHIPMQKKRFPLWSEKVDNQGYINIKISDSYSTYSGNWKRKHLWIWEQANGPVPKKHVVIFLDGDKLNCVLENLALVAKEENAQLNQLNLRSQNPEMTKTGIAIVRHRLAIYKRIKELGKKRSERCK